MTSISESAKITNIPSAKLSFALNELDLDFYVVM
jgi:hypothetical protein